MMNLKSEHGEANLKELMSSFDKFVSEEAGEGHDPNNLQEMRETFQRFLNEELAEKTWKTKSKGSKLLDTVSKVWTNILKAVDIEKSQPGSSDVHVPSTGPGDKVGKPKRKPKEHSFAIPGKRKYPIHDLKSARKSLARVSQNGDQEEQKVVRAAVEKKWPTLKSSYASHADLDPDIDNLTSGILKVALGDGENNYEESTTEDMNEYGDPESLVPTQQLVEGMDWEMEMNQLDQETAMTVASHHLLDDPWYYRSKWQEQNGTDDALEKSGDDSDDTGLHVDLGSGPVRESGYMGYDLYPYDHGTIVHDLNLGIPLPDECVSKIQMVNSLHTMYGLSDDPKPLLSEIQRVLMPGGQFVYEGPNDIFNYQGLEENTPHLVMTDHDDNDVQKDDQGQIFRQSFTRIARPDAATANDAEPRTGVPIYDELGGDMLAAMDALNYDWGDASTSAQGNRLFGYPSQGALIVNKSKDECQSKPERWIKKGGPGSGPQPGQGHPHEGGKKSGAKDPKKTQATLNRAINAHDDHPSAGNKAKLERAQRDHVEAASAHVENLKQQLHEAKQAPHDKVKASEAKHNEAQAKLKEAQEKYQQAKDKTKATVERINSDRAARGQKPIEHKTEPKKESGKKEEKKPGEHKPEGKHEEHGHKEEHHGEHGKHEGHAEHGHGHGSGLGEAIATATERLAESAEKKSKYRNRITLQKSGSSSRSVRIAKTDTHKQIVYGVITAPNEIDSQEDWMAPEDIEEAAHKYLIDSRVIGGEHTQPLKAVPVESYIAPQDLHFDGQNGPQTVTKGSWVMGVKILDPIEWQKVLDGTYTGFSVGGYGLRDQSNQLHGQF